jgi:hypothetical protein
VYASHAVVLGLISGKVGIFIFSLRLELGGRMGEKFNP